MQAPVTSASSTPTETTPRSAPELEALVGQLTHEVTQLRRQVAWFQRQIFGQKSERRLPVAEGIQGSLGESFDAIADVVPENKKTRVAAHERQPKHPSAATDESALFFDEKKVPIEVINVPNAEAEGLTPDAYEIIGEKVSHRLAQRPGSYVVLKYVRPVIKRRDTQVLSCPAAPVGVIEGSIGQYRIEAVSTGLAFEAAQIVYLTLAGLPHILAGRNLAADNRLRVLQGDFCIVLLSIRHGRVVSTRYQSRQRSPSSRCARAKQA